MTALAGLILVVVAIILVAFALYGIVGRFLRELERSDDARQGHP